MSARVLRNPRRRIVTGNDREIYPVQIRTGRRIPESCASPVQGSFDLHAVASRSFVISILNIDLLLHGSKLAKGCCLQSMNGD